MNIRLSRREFMQSAALFSALGVAPQFLTRTVEGAASIEGFKDDRVLVVVQLGGGNDGLNTLVPFNDDAYHRARPKLGLNKNRLIHVNDELALNDALVDFMRLYEDGQLAVIQGVGYPNPDRSHFRSMEIWQTASGSDEYLSSGWIGRYFDHACSGDARPQAGVAIGKERPQAFEGEEGFGIAFEDPRRFGWQAGQNGDTEERFAHLNRARGEGDENIDFLRHVTSNAIMSSHEVKRAAETSKLRPSGGNEFERALQTVAGLIRGGLSTRVFYVPASGFDTHANQSGQHDNLLGKIGEGLARFQRTLKQDGTSDRVLTMVFSEFGRRVVENYSGGTDHGTAAPMFLIGDGVRPGLHGAAPDLEDLVDGDLKHSTDFRSVYATVLDDWFQVDHGELLGRRFPGLGVIA